MIPEAGGSLSDSPPDAFSDDTGSVHEHAINQLAAAGILRGTSSGVYGADDPIDRAQLASILDRALAHLGVTLTGGENAFDDDSGSVHETRSEEHTSELQSLMRISYAVFCLKKKTTHNKT